MFISDACPVTCDVCEGNLDPLYLDVQILQINYNSEANEDNGSCVYSGCMCVI